MISFSVSKMDIFRACVGDDEVGCRDMADDGITWRRCTCDTDLCNDSSHPPTNNHNDMSLMQMDGITTIFVLICGAIASVM